MKSLSPNSNSQYSIKSCTTEKELNEILHLQAQNVGSVLSKSEQQSQGFVTVVHHLELLRKMNDPFPHQIAIDQNGAVIGYALVMESRWRNEIPVLIPMFEEIESITYNGNSIRPDQYAIMGQICIAKEYRGLGIFDALYKALGDLLQEHVPYLITEVAFRNKRSFRAHQRVGFEVLKKHGEEDGEEWALIIWNLK